MDATTQTQAMLLEAFERAREQNTRAAAYDSVALTGQSAATDAAHGNTAEAALVAPKVWPPLKCTQTYWTVTLATPIALYEPEGISHMTLEEFLLDAQGDQMRPCDIVELMKTLAFNNTYEGKTIERREYAVALDHGRR